MAEVLGQAEEAGGVRLDRSRLTGRGDEEYRVVHPYKDLPNAQRLVELTGRYHLRRRRGPVGRQARSIPERSWHRYKGLNCQDFHS